MTPFKIEVLPAVTWKFMRSTTTFGKPVAPPQRWQSLQLQKALRVTSPGQDVNHQVLYVDKRAAVLVYLYLTSPQRQAPVVAMVPLCVEGIGLMSFVCSENRGWIDERLETADTAELYH